MLERSRGLTDDAHAAITDLERAVVAHDGGRLKLEHGVLRSRPADRVQDLLWWDDGRLLGFLGLYRFGDHPLELAGMVAPDARRRGIGSALLDAAVGLAAEQGLDRALVVVPSVSDGGRALVRRRGATPAHAEHALALHGDPTPGPADPRTTLAPAGVVDAADVARVLAAGFGEPARDLTDQLAAEQDGERTWAVRRDGVVVGSLRLTRDGALGAVHGFAVDPAWQGRGIGRDVLRRACAHLRAGGVRRVTLEVETTNDRALGLYLSVGFERAATDEYWSLPVDRERNLASWVQ
ncbi:hypothetical protein GCM10027047_15120 [Rhodococcus aerolatus]